MNCDIYPTSCARFVRGRPIHVQPEWWIISLCSLSCTLQIIHFNGKGWKDPGSIFNHLKSKYLVEWIQGVHSSHKLHLLELMAKTHFRRLQPLADYFNTFAGYIWWYIYQAGLYISKAIADIAGWGCNFLGMSWSFTKIIAKVLFWFFSL